DEMARDGMAPEDIPNAVLIAMQDPDSEYYQRAVKRWSNNELLKPGIAFIGSPFRPRYRVINEDGSDIYLNLDQDTKNAVNTVDNRARTLAEQADRYYSIGDDRDKEINQAFNIVAYGTIIDSIYLDG